MNGQDGDGMFTNRPNRWTMSVLLLFGFVFCATDGRASPPEAPPPTLNPKQYNSPSGRYSLFVNPSDLHGRNGGSYRLTRDGLEVWSGSRPYTLWQAFVTDLGVTGGYAYSHGWRGFSDAGFKAGAGDFRVVIIDEHGKERLDQVTKREESRFLHTPPNPLATGLFVDAANDRMVVRVDDADADRRGEVWWTYHVSSGKPLATLRPNEQVPDPDPAAYIIDAKPVAGTPLTLVHWWRHRFDEQGRVGARFALIGLDGKPVWSSELPDDYSVPGDRVAEDRLMIKITQKGAILRTDQAGRYDLWYVRDARQVTFAVARGPTGAWTVTEIGRRPYVEPAASASSEAPIPERPLRLLGRIELKAPKSGPAPDVRDISDFVFDDRGRIAFLRDVGGKTPALVVTDQLGKIVQTVSLDAAISEHAGVWSGPAWLGGDRYHLLRGDPKNDKKMEAWRVDVLAATVVRIPRFSTTVLSEAAGFPDGGFVVKGGLQYFPGGATGDCNLYAFDANGRGTWIVIGGSGNGPADLFYLESVAVMTDGTVAVLDNIRELVQFFDRGGKQLRTIDLKKAWGRKPNYPTDVAADRDGGVLVLDFHGSPPLVRMGPDGAVRSEVRPKFPDGREFHLAAARVAPDGSLWVSDWHALLRLAESGVVDRVLGERPDTGRLGDADAVTVDFKGQIYAVAGRTGAVHIFEPGGRWLRVCSPDPSDVPEELSTAHLTVAESGDVYLGVSRDGRYLHFSPEGTRVGVESLELDEVTEKWYCQPGTGRRWVLGYEKVYLVDGAGKVLLTVARRADGKWLDRPDEASIAPDGSLAVLSSGREGPLAVTLYRPNGEPIRTITLPSSVTWSFPRLAFDGKLVAIAGKKEVVLFDASGEALGRFTPAQGDGSRWTPFLSPTSHELLLFNGRSTLYRFDVTVSLVDGRQ
jgi:hypothetical protein